MKIIEPSCLGSCQVLVLVLPATSAMEAAILGGPIAITEPTCSVMSFAFLELYCPRGKLTAL